MTVIYNAALVRYEGGHIYVDLSGELIPREVFIEMGGVRERSTATGIATSILATYASARTTQVDVGMLLEQSQIPGIGYRIGDLVDGQMLTSLTISPLGEATVQIAPEMGDPAQARLDELNRKLQRFSSGAVSEYGRPTSAVNQPGKQTDTTPPEFSLSGDVVASFSPWWRVPRPYQCSWITANLTTPGTTTTNVSLYRVIGDATYLTIGSVAIAAGKHRAIGVVNEGLDAGTQILFGCPHPGAGAKDLQASLRGVMV